MKHRANSQPGGWYPPEAEDSSSWDRLVILESRLAYRSLLSCSVLYTCRETGDIDLVHPVHQGTILLLPLTDFCPSHVMEKPVATCGAKYMSLDKVPIENVFRK